MNGDDERRIADVTLERYRLNELPAEAMAQVERCVREDAEARRRLDALQRSDEQLRESDRLGEVGARVQRALGARAAAAEPRTWMPAPRWAVPAAVGIVVILLLVIPRMTPLTPADEERIKGLQPSLSLFRRVGNGSETLADGAVAHPGDLIRIGYRAAGRAYGVILSIDGRRHVTMHLPPDGEAAASLGSDSTVLLDYSYELDDAPRWERFYFVTSEQPFAIAPVLAAAKRVAADGAETAALALPPGLEQATFSLLKESKP